jgi:hypothetical protein
VTSWAKHDPKAVIVVFGVIKGFSGSQPFRMYSSIAFGSAMFFFDAMKLV